MKFNRNKPAIKQIGLGRTVFDELSDHPICRPINDPIKDHKPEDLRNPDIMVWINPHDQFSFNSSWCSIQDLEDWMNGTGIMIKGKNDEEKKKYWDYAVFEATRDPWGIDHSKWLVKYTWKWFDQFVTDFDPNNHKNGHGPIDMQIKEPLKLKSNRTKDHLQNKIRTEEVIKAMLVPFVDYIVKELEYREWKHVRSEVENDLYGIKRTLYCLGYGYFGASNTPEEICNLKWVSDIIFGKGIYLWLKKQNYELLPDFEWLTNRDITND